MQHLMSIIYVYLEDGGRYCGLQRQNGAQFLRRT
jgi:hypothetical protein